MDNIMEILGMLFVGFILLIILLLSVNIFHSDDGGSKKDKVDCISKIGIEACAKVYKFN